MYIRYLKRVFDLCLAAVGILLMVPIFSILILLLAVVNGGKVFYFQNRPGLGGEIFRIIKFKTMNDRRDSTGKLLSDDARLTYLGGIIRTLSLDELPQLFNVLKGDMSLVGPRPLLKRYLALYSPEQARRHEVRPGITGWAQVSGRNNLCWEEKLKRDVWYVDNVNFSLDIKIIWLTIIRVLKCQDINQQGQATRTPFKGTSHSKEKMEE